MRFRLHEPEPEDERIAGWALATIRALIDLIEALEDRVEALEKDRPPLNGPVRAIVVVN